MGWATKTRQRGKRRRIGWTASFIFSFVILSAGALALSNGFVRPSLPGAGSGGGSGSGKTPHRVFSSKLSPQINPYTPLGVSLRKRLERVRRAELQKQYSSMVAPSLVK